MKIAFINDPHERFGIEHVSALLKANGHQTRLFIDPKLFDDGEFSVRWLARVFDHRQRLIAELKAYQPDLVGFSVDTYSYQWALGMARDIKKEMPVPIILGGIHPTSVPERVIDNESVDMVCVGEGEYAMLELVNSMAKGRVDHAIRNIWFKKDGRVIRNEVRPLIEDLDALPMPDKELYYSVSPHSSEIYFIMTGRGCANSCSYCCHSYLKGIYKNKGKYLRQRSIDNIIEELVHARDKYRIKMVRFWDDDFMVGRNAGWFREFSRRYKEKVGLPFICYLYPRDVPEEVIRDLKEAGCCEVNIGVQSWDDHVRREVLSRDTPNAEIDALLDVLKRNRINVTADFICGLPLQSDDDAVNFIRSCGRGKVGDINFFGIKYFPGSSMTQRMKANGTFSDLQYEEILEGKKPALIHMGGDLAFKAIIKFKVAAWFFKVFPQRVAEYCVEKKFYRVLGEVVPPWLLELIYNYSMTGHERKYLTRLHRRHYMHFIVKMIRSSFGGTAL